MDNKDDVKALLKLIEKLNHRQWEMIKTITDMAFEEKIKDLKVEFEEVEDLVCMDLIENGLKKE